MAIVVGILEFLSIFTSLSSLPYLSYLIIPMTAVLVIAILFSVKQSGNYRCAVKETIVKAVLVKTFADVYFNAKEGFSRDFIRSTELVPMGNRYYTNDFLSGTYKTVKFRQADVHIQQHTQSGKTSSTVTLFKGRWLVYTFNKRFTGFLQIRSNENRLFGNSKPLRWFSERPDTHKIKLENEQFNERFKIYASDEQEAFYILTPHFMEKLIELDDSLEGNLVVGFIDNEVHIALYNNRDAFEPSIFRPLDETYYQEIQHDIDLIKMVIDDLTLDVSLYK